jgi:nicotinamidase-related amidase
MADQLLPFPLTERSVHLCVDMQRIFSAVGPWPTPWMEKVLPVVGALVSRHPERTVFTRFIPPERPVATLLHALACCDPRTTRSAIARADAAAFVPLPTRGRH